MRMPFTKIMQFINTEILYFAMLKEYLFNMIKIVETRKIIL